MIDAAAAAVGGDTDDVEGADSGGTAVGAAAAALPCWWLPDSLAGVDASWKAMWTGRVLRIKCYLNFFLLKGQS